MSGAAPQIAAGGGCIKNAVAVPEQDQEVHRIQIADNNGGCTIIVKIGGS
jgi:hypothetical protein